MRPLGLRSPCLLRYVITWSSSVNQRRFQLTPPFFVKNPSKREPDMGAPPAPASPETPWGGDGDPPERLLPTRGIFRQLNNELQSKIGRGAKTPVSIWYTRRWSHKKNTEEPGVCTSFSASEMSTHQRRLLATTPSESFVRSCGRLGQDTSSLNEEKSSVYDYNRVFDAVYE